MSLLRLDAMPSHARRHTPYLPLLPLPTPLCPPASLHIALLWMIAMVLPLSSGSPHLWASRGEAAALTLLEWEGIRTERKERSKERWQVEGRSEVCCSFYSLKWQAAVAHTTRSMATLAEDAARGKHAHTHTHTHRNTHRES